mmetsp:Transcript_39268/g.94643  ORF Transcript_39268/g.94643 Transcript_39268/m.94643 type:complete len:261 (-) Transcript_39268:1010-1792(-)
MVLPCFILSSMMMASSSRLLCWSRHTSATLAGAVKFCICSTTLRLSGICTFTTRLLDCLCICTARWSTSFESHRGGGPSPRSPASPFFFVPVSSSSPSSPASTRPAAGSAIVTASPAASAAPDSVMRAAIFPSPLAAFCSLDTPKEPPVFGRLLPRLGPGSLVMFRLEGTSGLEGLEPLIGVEACLPFVEGRDDSLSNCDDALRDGAVAGPPSSSATSGSALTHTTWAAPTRRRYRRGMARTLRPGKREKMAETCWWTRV